LGCVLEKGEVLMRDCPHSDDIEQMKRNQAAIVKTLETIEACLEECLDRIALTKMVCYTNLDVMKQNLVEFEFFLPEDAKQVRRDLKISFLEDAVEGPPQGTPWTS
jgi:enamine deaminase RidA (YjgF/YER057c/UK114 family)|tara:strand:+ start:2419 stop:2736 length:318 start_codon:yes stop_codon:yes gene_type:complete